MRRVLKPLAAGALAAAISIPVLWAPPASAAEPWKLSATGNGGSSSLNVNARFVAPTAGTFVLDVEIHSTSGKVQQWHQNVTVGASSTTNMQRSWSSAPSGEYTVKLGVFTQDWRQLLSWNDNATKLKVAAATTTANAPAQGGGASSSAGTRFWGVNYHALEQSKAWSNNRSNDARLMERLAYTPTAQWFGGWTPNVGNEVSKAVGTARSNNATAVLVAYNIVGRDCSGHSSGGAGSEGDYKQWISNFASGIQGRPAYVILEPDALPQLCGDTASRYRMLNHAVDVLNGAGARVYIDAGHSNWIDPSTMADRLKQAGVYRAAGFAVNVANFYTTSQSQSYGESISSRLGGKKYVVDTSRNGSGSSGQWCNPREATVGQTPTTNTSAANADAYLWVKSVGDSDGYCNGGPGAGQWSSDIAMSLTRNWR